MSKSFFNCNPLFRIESQTFLHEVDSQRFGFRVHLGKLLLFLEWKSSEIISGSVRVDLVEVVERGSAEDIEDEGELMMVCTDEVV
jgi:hypothetical protein